MLPIESDGSLEMASSFVQHEGASVHPRQTGPHAHCVKSIPPGDIVLAADLGTDQVVIYQVRWTRRPDHAEPARCPPPR